MEQALKRTFATAAVVSASINSEVCVREDFCTLALLHCLRRLGASQRTAHLLDEYKCRAAGQQILTSMWLMLQAPLS
eukprot:5312524-Pleurochrysis_carterae.AAC.2